MSKKYKKRLVISVIVVGVSFFAADIVQSNVAEAEEEAQTKAYKTDKKDFIDKYASLGYSVESLSNKEGED